tara:strand:- start:4330 stop:4494 length:165 start_codon:yes stop_codon:yes gene_type:complete
MIRIPSIDELQEIAPQPIFQDSYNDGIAVYDGISCINIEALKLAIYADIAKRNK